MNPFTESTVARSVAPVASTAWPRSRRSWKGLAHAAGLAARVGMAGILLGPAWAGATDINSASLQQLQSIKGIGPKTAQIILDERQRGGDYESFDDLSDRVKGIGPKKAASLRAQGLSVGAGSAAPGSRASPAAAKAPSPKGRAAPK
ncbi:MAG: DUF655 domain-containing protein [Candidimonas sp.]|jgi:competence protein ComEA